MSDQPFVGQIATFAGRRAPRGWAMCDGSLLEISKYKDLFNVIKNVYGGDGTTNFALPDLRGRLTIHQAEGFSLGSIGGQEQVTLNPAQLPSHSHNALAITTQANLANPSGAVWAYGSNSYTTDPLDALMSPNAIDSAGGGQAHNNMMPFLSISFIIALEGVTPDPHQDADNEYFIGEVRLTAFGFAPGGWRLADGQLLPIASNQALFSLLGTTYGGDGRTTFALPDLQGRTPIHRSQDHQAGQTGGQQAHILTLNEIPVHSHRANANVESPNPSPSNFPAGAIWGVGAASHYARPAGSVSPMNPKAISSVGGFEAHQNMQPFQVINFIVRTGGSILPQQ